MKDTSQPIPPEIARDYGLNDNDVRNSLHILRRMPPNIRESAICGGPPHDGPWWTSPEPTECYYAAMLSILQKLDLIGKDILEVGCSMGYFVKVLSFLGSHAVGIDKDADEIKDAKDVELIHGRIEQPPVALRKQKFDVVIQRLVLTQEHDLEHILVSIYEFLRPDGYFVSQDGDVGAIFSQADLEAVGFKVILQEGRWKFLDYDTSATYYDEYESITIMRKPSGN